MMKYWIEMESKFGFNDGDSMPSGVEVYREVYLKAVNALAKKHGSKVRAVPFDRPGMHNWCLWVLIPTAWFEKKYLPRQNGKWVPIGNDDELLSCDLAADAAFQAAVEAAMDLGLDEFVNVTVEVQPGFAELLQELVAVEQGLVE
jgi:hypothetical protein